MRHALVVSLFLACSIAIIACGNAVDDGAEGGATGGSGGAVLGSGGGGGEATGGSSSGGSGTGGGNSGGSGSGGLPQVCEPGEPLCVGERATVCAPDGSGAVLGGEECATGQHCYGGECLEVICSGSYQCVEGDVRFCAREGTGLDLIDACSPGYHCREDRASCLLDVCAGGQPYCNGGFAFVCADDGSGPTDEGVECGLGNVCVFGECLPVLCLQLEFDCVDGDVVLCNEYGTGFWPLDTCAEDQFCMRFSPECVDDRCVAGEKFCDWGRVATCKADGSGAITQGYVCPAGQVCDGGECVPWVP